jgi:hypothetical protein
LFFAWSELLTCEGSPALPPWRLMGC